MVAAKWEHVGEGKAGRYCVAWKAGAEQLVVVLVLVLLPLLTQGREGATVSPPHRRPPEPSVQGKLK